jgi:hypothetical protein
LTGEAMTEKTTHVLPSDQQIKITFLDTQYVALRQEEENAKQRGFYLYALGAIIVPSIQQLLQYLTQELPTKDSVVGSSVAIRLTVIKAMFPFLIIAILFLFIAENKAIKRIGLHIKEQIEESFVNDLRIVGWETWLARNPGRQYAAFSFILLFGIYYAVFTLAVLVDIYTKWSQVLGVIVFLGYGLIWFATQCHFVHEIWHDDPESQCAYERVFIEGPAYIKSKLRVRRHVV